MMMMVYGDTESPDVMKFLRHVIKLCFPDNYDDLFNHTDGRYATSPLALLDILDRLQHLISGGSTYTLIYFYHFSVGCASISLFAWSSAILSRG